MWSDDCEEVWASAGLAARLNAAIAAMKKC
jgi:hypothetical protein